MKLVHVFIFIFLLLFISGCSQKKTYPDPTNKFYVNDYADALMAYTENEIVAYNHYLYDTYGEIQIVYATFLVDDFMDIAEIDKTNLYRQWEIGRNDKGVLILLFFEEIMIDDFESTTLVAYSYEVGYELEPIITPSFMMQTIADTLLNEAHADISDLMVMHLNYEMLNHVYTSVYDETPILYDMDDYYDELMAAPYIPEEDYSDLFYDAFSLFDGSSGSLVLVGAFIVFGAAGITKFRGGGGSSGGAGLFRRRH